MPVDTIFYVFVVVILIVNFNHYRKCDRPFLSAIFGAISGILFFIPISIILKTLGYNLLINYTTIILSSILGIPGVILMGLLLFL